MEQCRRAPEAHGPPSEAVVAAVTNGRIDGFAERSTEGQAESLALGSGS